MSLAEKPRRKSRVIIAHSLFIVGPAIIRRYDSLLRLASTSARARVVRRLTVPPKGRLDEGPQMNRQYTGWLGPCLFAPMYEAFKVTADLPHGDRKPLWGAANGRGRVAPMLASEDEKIQ